MAPEIIDPSALSERDQAMASAHNPETRSSPEAGVETQKITVAIQRRDYETVRTTLEHNPDLRLRDETKAAAIDSFRNLLRLGIDEDDVDSLTSLFPELKDDFVTAAEDKVLELMKMGISTSLDKIIVRLFKTFPELESSSRIEDELSAKITGLYGSSQPTRGRYVYGAKHIPAILRAYPASLRERVLARSSITPAEYAALQKTANQQ